MQFQGRIEGNEPDRMAEQNGDESTLFRHVETYLLCAEALVRFATKVCAAAGLLMTQPPAFLGVTGPHQPADPSGVEDDVVEPVPSVGDRVAQFARKRCVVFATAAALLLLLILGEVRLTVGLTVGNDQRRQEKPAGQERQTALDTHYVVLRIPTSHLSNLHEEERLILFDVLRAAQAQAGEIEAQSRCRSRDWRSAALAAETWFRIGSIATELNREEEAEKAYRRAIELYAALANHFPADPVYRDEMAEAHFDLALLLAKVGKPDAAVSPPRRSSRSF